jgi:hypothetical protein
MDNNNLPAVWAAVGPGVSGAVFGAAWWFWVDAVVCSATAVPFLHYLPGNALPKLRPFVACNPYSLESSGFKPVRGSGFGCLFRVLRFVRRAHVQLRQEGGHQ